jgi:hypothetical protein
MIFPKRTAIRTEPRLFADDSQLLDDPAPVRVWNNIAMRWTGAGSPPPDGSKASV